MHLLHVRKATETALLALCLISLAHLNGQQRDWRTMLNDQHVNFYQVQALFEAEYPDYNYPKGSGWKKFKRWEEYYQGRIDERGNLPNRENFIREVRASNLMQKSSGSSLTSNWTEVGPINKPANETGQPNGNGRLNCVAFHPTDANTLYVGSPSGGLWESNDGGDSWTKRGDANVRLGVSSIVIHPTNPDIIYLGTGDRDAGDAPGYGVWRSLDGGLTLQPYNNGMGNVTINEIIMHPNNPDILIASSSNNRIFRTTNGGANWSAYNIGEDCEDLAIHPTNPEIMYAAGANVYRSTNNGVTWTRVPNNTGFNPNGHNRTAIAVSPDSPNVLYALSSGGSGFKGLYYSDDTGLTWVRRSNSPNLNGYDVNGNDDRSQSFYDQVLAVDPENVDQLFFGGINVWESSNGGSSWEISSHWVGSGNPSVHADHHALAYNPLDGKLYDGNDGGLYVTDDGGQSWIEKSNGLAIAQIYKIGVSQNTRDLAINGYQDNGTSVYYPDRGWVTEYGGDGFECVYDPTDDNYVYGSIYYGEVFRSTTGGNSWRTISGDEFGAIDEGGAFSAPFTLDPNDPETLYLGMRNVWRSTNARAATPTWTKISTWANSTMHDIVVSPANSNHIMAATDNGGLRRTTNGLATSPTWTNIRGNLPGGTSLIKDIAYHPTQPNTVYVANRNNIYRSLDNGNTWESVRGSLPNISINCIAFGSEDDNAGVYVGLDVGVYYRAADDGDWRPYSTELPNVEVTDLELYYNEAEGTTTVYASTYGAGMWKSPGVLDGNAPPVANFSDVVPQVCEANVISLTDRSTFNPTSWSWTVTPANVTFINGTTATSRNPEFSFTEDATFTVELTVTNQFGSDQVTKQLVVDRPLPNNLPLVEDFQVLNPDFAIVNPDQSATWELLDVTAPDGTFGTSLSVDNYNYNAPGQLDNYRSPRLDGRAASSIDLSFQLAYAPYDFTFSDGLRVEVSTDCGDSWETIYDEEGLALSTTGGYVTDPFSPTANQWRTELLDLTPYSGEIFQVRFVNVNGYGNNMYLEDIQIAGVAALPIRLNSFSGLHNPKTGNELTWLMDEEEPDLTFTVQRYHPRSGEWRKIGQEVPGDGSLRYGLVDTYPEIGTNAYRLELRQSGEVVDYSAVIQIETEPSVSDLSISPNPTSGMLTLRTQSLSASLQDLRVIDVTGRIVLRKTLEMREGAQAFSVDLSPFPAGVYFLRFGEVTKRIIRD